MGFSGMTVAVLFTLKIMLNLSFKPVLLRTLAYCGIDIHPADLFPKFITSEKTTQNHKISTLNSACPNTRAGVNI